MEVKDDASLTTPVQERILELAGLAEYGVGGGITHDSRADAEYGEVLAKARVLTVRRPAFELAECQTIARTCRVFLDNCIEDHLNGELDGADAAMVKYWLTEQQCAVATREQACSAARPVDRRAIEDRRPPHDIPRRLEIGAGDPAAVGDQRPALDHAVDHRLHEGVVANVVEQGDELVAVLIPSRSEPGTYWRVDLATLICGCPDFRFRRAPRVRRGRLAGGLLQGWRPWIRPRRRRPHVGVPRLQRQRHVPKQTRITK